MERRLGRLEALRWRSLLAEMAVAMAEEEGLDPADVLAEAEALLPQLLARLRSGETLEELAAEQGQTLAEVEREVERAVAEFRARWRAS